MKICGIPVPGTPQGSEQTSAQTSVQTKSPATGDSDAQALIRPLGNALVHAVEEGDASAVCGISTKGLHLWREEWPGRKFLDHTRCPDCKRVLSPSG